MDRTRCAADKTLPTARSPLGLSDAQLVRGSRHCADAGKARAIGLSAGELFVKFGDSHKLAPQAGVPYPFREKTGLLGALAPAGIAAPHDRQEVEPGGPAILELPGRHPSGRRKESRAPARYTLPPQRSSGEAPPAPNCIAPQAILTPGQWPKPSLTASFLPQRKPVPAGYAPTNVPTRTMAAPRPYILRNPSFPDV